MINIKQRLTLAGIVSLSFGLMVLVSIRATAQDQALDDVTGSTDASQSTTSIETIAPAQRVAQRVVPIEQINVVGQRSFFLLRAQIETAREALYSTYNDSNLIDDYDVNCRKSDWTGTHIQEQDCWPVFFEKIVAENSQDALLNGDLFLTPVPHLLTQYRDRFDDLRANIVKVAAESPNVEDALLELGTLEKALERKREECMRKDAFLFIFRWC